MIVFNEGLPGSGKSYDSMLTHILPALKKGRHVYARLNGLEDPARYHLIAEHLEVPSERVQELLHHLTDAEVEVVGSIVQKNALIVIDECHEFYVASREAMSKSKEELFAKHRHEGLDIVLMSQFYKRLHSAVRGRVERKFIFTKLNAVKMKDRYKVEQWTAVAPDKYEKIDSLIKKYDPSIFPLYKSVADGTTNMEVYSEGTVSPWRKVIMWAAVMIPLGIWAIWMLSGVFSKDSSLVHGKTMPGVMTGGPVIVGSQSNAAPVQKGPQLDTSKKKGVDTTGMPAPIAYVFDIASQGRPRCAAVYQQEHVRDADGIVEFREAQGHVLERLTLKQLRAMGFAVAANDWGVSLVFQKDTIVATQWPVDMPGANSVQQNQAIDSTPIFDVKRLRIGGQVEDRTEVSPVPSNLPSNGGRRAPSGQF